MQAKDSLSFFFILFICINFPSPSIIYPWNHWEFFEKAQWKSSQVYEAEHFVYFILKYLSFLKTSFFF